MIYGVLRDVSRKTCGINWCEIFWTLIPPENGLQIRLAVSALFKKAGIKFPTNPAGINSANYSLPEDRHRALRQRGLDVKPVGSESTAALR
jgi:hypothetical protein